MICHGVLLQSVHMVSTRSEFQRERESMCDCAPVTLLVVFVLLRAVVLAYSFLGSTVPHIASRQKFLRKSMYKTSSTRMMHVAYGHTINQILTCSQIVYFLHNTG